MSHIVLHPSRSTFRKFSVMYAGGTGVPEDYVKAWMWLLLAKVQSNKFAAGFMDIIEPALTTTYKAQAQAQAHAAELLEKYWLGKYNT